MQVDEMENSGDERETELLYDYISRMIGGVFSSALTGFFALAGACTGAVTGALAGKASHSGFLRGAGLGAVAGAILSLEVLKASRAYWCSDRSGSRNSSLMADFVEELFRGRFVEEPFSPPVSITYHWQVSIANIHDGVHNNSEVASKGLSSKSLRELPCHIVRNEVTPSQRICCTICLQDFELGDMVRSLPGCLHTFHLTCVDKWLIQHGSCPVCRQHVQV